MQITTVVMWLASVVFLSAVIVRERRKNAAKLELIARAEHEIRGPITAACIGLEANFDTDISSRERIVAVRSALAGAAAALDDLTNARSSNSGLVLKPNTGELLDVDQLVERVVAIWQPLAERLGVGLEIQPAVERLTVIGDPVRLQQVCSNLIANALEHGRGPITVAVRAETDRCMIEVSDRGAGMPVSLNALAGAIRPGHGRRGRGLAIANQIATDHGGLVRALPSKEGARVAVELPLMEAV